MGTHSWRLAALPTAVACLAGIGAGAQTIAVTAPNGGETWIAGTVQQITWTSSGYTGKTSVSIYYSTNNGTAWTAVTSSTLNDGAYSWTVPATPSSACLVRVREYPFAIGDPSDTSDAPFTIAPPEHTVSAPDAPSGQTFGVVDTT